MSVPGTRAHEKRRSERHALRVPVRIRRGRDAGLGREGGTWEEMTTCRDVSYGGVGFFVRRPLEPGDLLHLSLPLPKRFRRYDLVAPAYQVYALVRHVQPHDGGSLAGALFLGRNPPRPRATTQAGASSQERRRCERLPVFVHLRLRREQHGIVQEELTVTRDLGREGAKIPTSLPIVLGEVLTIEEPGGTFRTRADVRALSHGSGGLVHLHLRFLDSEPPVTLVPAEDSLRLRSL